MTENNFIFSQKQRRAKKKSLLLVFYFLVANRSLLTLNTLMGKKREREQKSKMEIVINMLMLGREAGKSSFYPSLSYLQLCEGEGGYRDRDGARMKVGGADCAQHCMRVRGQTHTGTRFYTQRVQESCV